MMNGPASRPIAGRPALPSRLQNFRYLAKLLAICVATVLLQFTSAHKLAASGKSIYQQKCASCHGASGSGVEDYYEGPLFGDDSLDELAARIDATMPEDNPEACVGEEARAVAEFIYHEFYSYEARLAKGLVSPPRVELARLTVPQYRNAVADLLTHFAPPPRDLRPKGFVGQSESGILGSYYQSKKMNKRNKLRLIRLDSEIDFDFAQGSPDKNIDPDAFAIIWNGSLQVRDTGHYNFRIQSPNGVRLYVNTQSSKGRGKLRDDDSAKIQPRLIDGWVSSGEMRTLTGRIFLLGGRRYPLRLEFFKYQEPTASIRLEWKPPHGVWTTLDEQALSIEPAARTFVVDTPFPADDRSVGYERGASISQAWHNAVTDAALDTADEVLDRLTPAFGQTQSEKPAAMITEWFDRFASLAFRRPLTKLERDSFRQSISHADDPETALRLAVLQVLTSPHFLYNELTPPDSTAPAYAIAARLALVMWDSIPDTELRRAAKDDQLRTTEQIEVHARRMLDDPRARTKLRRFFQHWLELEERDLAKDQHKYPKFDEATIVDLRRSLELFVEHVVWSESSDYRELLQADYLLLNDRLKKLYGRSAPVSKADQAVNGEFRRFKDSTEGRSGILTHPYLLSAFAYHDNTSPIHRGVFLTRNIVGRQLKPPPVDVSFDNQKFEPHLTMREKVTELTSDQACLSCHQVINPLGFALENFDAVGRWRNTDNNRPIDSKSDYTSEEGKTLTIKGARDIANFAVSSSSAHRAFVTQAFQYMVQQNPEAYGPQTIEQLRRQFVADEFHIRNLLVRIATVAASHNLTGAEKP